MVLAIPSFYNRCCSPSPLGPAVVVVLQAADERSWGSCWRLRKLESEND